MDLPYHYTLFHHPVRPEQQVAPGIQPSPHPQNGNVSLLQTASRLGAEAFSVFGSVASQLAIHPKSLLHGPWDASWKEQRERLAFRHRLLQQLSTVASWSEYDATCIELDRVEGAEVWKDVDDSQFYDVICLRSRTKRLVAAHENDDLEEMVHLVRCELTRDLGAMCEPELHQQTRTGTKFLIDHYVATVHDVLERIVGACALRDPRLYKLDVQAELEQTRRSYGRTALLLSGGGTLGMVHIGVIKALHEADALPRIISGSSSGSIVAAVLGSTTDEDLIDKLHDFCHGDLAVFVGPHEESGWCARAKQFGKKGYLFDLGNLRRVMVDLLGKTTFLEAYNRTRRVLNITVSNSSRFDSQQVLNYATAGNVVIWSAVVASCAVPFGFEPERLLFKRDEDPKDLIPWDPNTHYVDGSINGDLPTSILSAEFDVNHSIASQVNPHAAPFLKSSEKLKSDQHTAYWITAASLAKDEAIRSMEVLSELPCLERNNNIMTKLSSVLSQRYSGDITLLPVDALGRFWTILNNPTPRSMEESTEQGERATWPMLSMIKTHMDIELLIDDAVRRVSEHISFSQSASDLRRLRLKPGKVSHRLSGDRLRTRERLGHRIRHSEVVLPRPIQIPLSVSPQGVSVPGSVVVKQKKSPRSMSSSTSVSLDSEDDAAGEMPTLSIRRSPDEAESVFLPDESALTVRTQPSSPTAERKSFSDLSRTSSSASAPMSLLMTPVAPRANSSETRRTYPVEAALQLRPTPRSPPPGFITSSPESSRQSSPVAFFRAQLKKKASSRSRSGRASPVDSLIKRSK